MRPATKGNARTRAVPNQLDTLVHQVKQFDRQVTPNPDAGLHFPVARTRDASQTYGVRAITVAAVRP